MKPFSIYFTVNANSHLEYVNTHIILNKLTNVDKLKKCGHLHDDYGHFQYTQCCLVSVVMYSKDCR